MREATTSLCILQRDLAEGWCWSVGRDRTSVKRLSFNLGPHHPPNRQMMSPSQSERNKCGAELQLLTPVGLEVPVRRFAIGSDTDSIGSPDLEGDVDGSFASGDEEVFEVPANEMVPPVRPSVASMRAGWIHLCSHRGSLMRSVPRFLWGSFRVPTKLALGFSMEWNGMSCNKNEGGSCSCCSPA